MLDFNVRVSDKEAYVSPTRGAQGNALKTLVAMPFAIDGDCGAVEVAARGVRHKIRMRVDPIRRQPIVEHETVADGDVKAGTNFTLLWPDSACSTLFRAKDRFLQLADNYTWLNPHLTMAVDWFGAGHRVRATRLDWPKWVPSNPMSPHWYQLEHFERLVGAYIANDADTGGTHSVGKLLAEFKGLTGTAKRKALLAETGLGRTNLTDLVKDGRLDRHVLQELLDGMKGASRPVDARDLGVIGEDHLRDRTRHFCCDLETFKYKCRCGETDGLPWVVEVAFAALVEESIPRRLVTGVNWSPAIANPFSALGSDESLDSILAEQWADQSEPVAVFLHLACPRVEYRDRGKSTVVIDY